MCRGDKTAIGQVIHRSSATSLVAYSLLRTLKVTQILPIVSNCEYKLTLSLWDS